MAVSPTSVELEVTEQVMVLGDICMVAELEKAFDPTEAVRGKLLE